MIGAYNFAQIHSPVTMFGNQVFASHLPLALAGGVIMVGALYLWALEGPGGYHIHIGPDGKVTESRGDHH
jgi:cytochrome c oxidase subunit 1